MKHYAQRFLLYALGVILFSTAICVAAENVASLIETGEYQQATRYLQERARSTKDVDQLSNIYHRLGEIYYTYTHEYSKALNAYARVVQLSNRGLTAEDLFLAYIKKGDVYCRVGRYNDAIQTYQTLVDQFPPTHFAHQTSVQKIRNIQIALEDLRNQQRIMRTYKETPRAITAQFQIAELYRSHYHLNRPEQAITEYDALLKQHRHARVAPEAQWRVGNLRHKVLNQPELAINAYQKVTDNYPTSNFAADALFQIARIHEEQGRYELAVSIFDQLPQTYPGFWSMHAVFYWSGVCYEKLRDYRRALRGFTTFLHVYLPSLEPAYFGAIGKHDQSLHQIKTELREKIQQLQADLPKVEWKWIEQQIAEANYAAALPMARQLIADIPDSEYAKSAKSQLHSLEQYAAIQNLQDGIRKQPGTPTIAHAQFQIGMIFERKLQDYAHAIEAYSQLIGVSPESSWAAEAMYRTASIYAEHLNDPKKAIGLYQDLIKQYPSSAQVMMASFQLGEVYRSLHRYDEALKSYQTTIAYPEKDLYLAEGYNDSFADRAQFRIGRVHYEDQRYDDAFIAFQEFIESRPRSPRLSAAYVYLALIHQERDDRRKAAEAYAEARRLTIRSPVQTEMVIDEVPLLGFQGTDPRAVIQRLDELHERVSGE